MGFDLIVARIQEMTLHPPEVPMNTHDFLIWIEGYSDAVTHVLDLLAEMKESFGRA